MLIALTSYLLRQGQIYRQKILFLILSFLVKIYVFTTIKSQRRFIFVSNQKITLTNMFSIHSIPSKTFILRYTLLTVLILSSFLGQAQLKSYKKGLTSFESGYYDIAIKEFSKVYVESNFGYNFS